MKRRVRPVSGAKSNARPKNSLVPIVAAKKERVNESAKLPDFRPSAAVRVFQKALMNALAGYLGRNIALTDSIPANFKYPVIQNAPKPMALHSHFSPTMEVIDKYYLTYNNSKITPLDSRIYPSSQLRGTIDFKYCPEFGCIVFFADSGVYAEVAPNALVLIIRASNSG